MLWRMVRMSVEDGLVMTVHGFSPSVGTGAP